MTTIQNIIITRSPSQKDMCPMCLRNVVDVRNGSWYASAESGPEAGLPLCTVCISELDDRVRIALDVLNFRPQI